MDRDLIMLVSVCVPIYEVEAYIKKCCYSLFSQTYENIEYVFVNDCTKDNSIKLLFEVLHDFPKRTGQVVIIKHSHNLGLAAARNTAVKNAKGDFLLHVDSDDYIDEDYIEKLVEKQLSTDADIVSGGCVAEYGTYIEKWPDLSLSNKEEVVIRLISKEIHNNIWGRLIRKSLYTSNNIYVKEGVNNSEDYQVIPKLFYVASIISYVSSSYYHYNKQNRSSYTQKRSLENDMQLLISFDILNDYFKSKGNIYQDALNIGEIKIISWGLRHLNKIDKVNKYFKILMDRLDKIDKKYYKNVDVASRIAFYVHNEKIIISLLNVYDLLRRYK